MPEQLETVRDALGSKAPSGIPLSGVLITHLHLGHYWGLGHMGKEGMMPQMLTVLPPPGAAAFLRNNRPFKDLIAYGALDVRPVRPGEEVPLADGLTATPHEVRHREDFSDTVAWIMRGPRASVLYAPDMDVLGRTMIDLVCTVDLAIVDGTFYTADEIPGAMDRVPHPPVTESMVALGPALEDGTRVAFTHLNHTNPLCDPRSPETEDLLKRGFGVVLDGYAIDI
jgi:pyrroloquinoline quinone biosynthesis protein B